MHNCKNTPENTFRFLIYNIDDILSMIKILNQNGYKYLYSATYDDIKKDLELNYIQSGYVQQGLYYIKLYLLTDIKNKTYVLETITVSKSEIRLDKINKIRNV